jgi:tetratricopeptide (TPR) repeat protein
LFQAGLTRAEKEIQQKDYTAAKKILYDIITTATAQKKTHFLVDGLLKLGKIFLEEQNFTQASVLFQQSLDFASEENYSKSKSKALYQLFIVNFLLGEENWILRYSAKVITALKDHSMTRSLFNVYHFLGIFYWRQNNFPKINELIEKIEDLPFSEIADEQLFTFHYNFGQIYCSNRQLKQALDYLEKASRFLERSIEAHRHHLVHLYCELADLRLFYDDNELVFQLLQNALEAVPSKDENWQIVHFQYARFLAMIKKYDKAKVVFLKVKEEDHKNWPLYLQSQFYYTRGFLEEKGINFSSKGQIKSLQNAVNYYHQALLLLPEQNQQITFELFFLLKMSLIRCYALFNLEKAHQELDQILQMLEDSDTIPSTADINCFLVKALLFGLESKYLDFAESLTIAERRIRSSEDVEKEKFFKAVSEIESAIEMRRKMNDALSLDSGAEILYDLLLSFLKSIFTTTFNPKIITLYEKK